MSKLQKIYILQGQFSSAHLYYQPKWSDEQNRQTFGRCYTQFGHGHNYQLEVSVELNGNESQLAVLQSQLQQVTSELDHEHLNFSIPFFKNNIPTTENIAGYLLEKLKAQGFTDKIKKLKLYEMPNLWVEVQP